MIEAARVQSIPEVLERLRNAPTDRHYLSVHLDTSPGQTIGEAYQTWFRDAIRRLKDDLPDADRDDRIHFERAVEEADQFVHHQASPEPAGLAIYTDGSGEFHLAVPLPMSPTNTVTWNEYPAIGPLVDAIDDQERTAVAVLSKEQTRIFTIFLGEIENQVAFSDDVAGKQATGEWFGLSQKRFDRRHDLQVMQHVKRTSRALMDELRARPFDRLLIGGAPEAVTTLTHQLPRPLRDRLAGTFDIEMFASDAEVVAAAMREAEAAERRSELDDVRTLLEASTGQNAAVGADATLAVLNEGRVHRIFIARDLEAAGGECTSCQRLVLDGDQCPVCGAVLEALPSIRERAIAYALQQGARVELVSGEAADVLNDHGGMAAWTRY